MVQQFAPDTAPHIIYPDSDGQPMADNTKQFRWIVVIKENLELLFANQADVFVAGDLLWYPIQGDTLRQAPDVMVVFGRPKGDRGSYRQWEEDNIAPQIVFEILSPGNRLGEMLKKLDFYRRYGVEEYYIYDPHKVELTGLIRDGDELSVIENMEGWNSPRLKIRFHLTDEVMEIYRPDGEKFLTSLELLQQRDAERLRAEEALAQLEKKQQRVVKLEAKLRELGVEIED